MKKFKFIPLFLIITILTSLMLSSTAFALDEPALESSSAVVLDRSTGEVLFEKNADWKVYPASTTKIMTVLLAVEAIERGDVSIYDEITATSSMTYDLVDDGSTAGILVGETMTLEAYLYCAMVSSANEACNVIAEHVGGTIPDFIDRMNARATELGCTNTHFANTHGLPDDNHYTTPEDFALIVMAATGHDLFMQICGSDTVTLPATNMSKSRVLNNSNALISDKSMYGDKYLYEYAQGIKTGYTSAAGYCLASAAIKDDIDLIAVVFGGVTYQSGGSQSYTNFSDTIALYDWVFNNFSYQEIIKSTETVTEVGVALGEDADHINLRPESSIVTLMPNDFSADEFERTIKIYSEEEGEELRAPIDAGSVLGEVSLSRNGRSYGTVKLIAASGVSLSRAQFMKEEIKAATHSTLFKVIVAVIVVLGGGYIALVVSYRIRRQRHLKAVRAAKAERARRQAEQEGTRMIKTAEKAPVIDFFPDESAGTEDDSTEKEISAKAERDYFEEFFKNK